MDATEVELRFANGEVLLKLMSDDCWRGRTAMVVGRSDRPGDGSINMVRVPFTGLGDSRPIFKEVQCE